MAPSSSIASSPRPAVRLAQSDISMPKGASLRPRPSNVLATPYSPSVASSSQAETSPPRSARSQSGRLRHSRRSPAQTSRITTPAPMILCSSGALPEYRRSCRIPLSVKALSQSSSRSPAAKTSTARCQRPQSRRHRISMTSASADSNRNRTEVCSIGPDSAKISVTVSAVTIPVMSHTKASVQDSANRRTGSRR